MTKSGGVLLSCCGAISLLAGMPAQAGFMDGNTLLERCESTQSDFRQGYCAAYVAGVVDTLPMATEVKQVVCIPPTATLQQLRDVAVDFLMNNPSTRHFDASALMIRALVVAFPC